MKCEIQWYNYNRDFEKKCYFPVFTLPVLYILDLPGYALVHSGLNKTQQITKIATYCAFDMTGSKLGFIYLATNHNTQYN